MDDPCERTCYVSNLHDNVTEELLRELFIQVGPLETLILRTSGNRDGSKSASSAHRYALAVFKHEVTVPFACEMLDRIELFNKPISVRPKQGTQQALKYRTGTAKATSYNTVVYSPAAYRHHDSRKRGRDESERIYGKRPREDDRAHIRHIPRNDTQVYDSRYVPPEMRNMPARSSHHYSPTENIQVRVPSRNTGSRLVGNVQMSKGEMMSGMCGYGVLGQQSYYPRDVNTRPLRPAHGTMPPPNEYSSLHQQSGWIPFPPNTTNLSSNTSWRDKQSNAPYIRPRVSPFMKYQNMHS